MHALILALTAATQGAPATPADGTYTYVSAMNGTALGKTVITVKHDAKSVVLSEQGGGTYNGQQGTVSDTLTLDPAQLSPVAYTANADLQGRPVNMALNFNGNTVTQTGDVVQRSYDLAQEAKHFVVLDMGPFSGWFALPAQMRAWNQTPATAIVPAMGSGITIAPDASAASPARPKTVPAGDASLSVSQPMPFTLWYDPKTMLVDLLEFPTQGVTVTRQ